MQRGHSQQGNSLLELMVVLVIVGLLTRLACDTLINSARRSALRAAAINLAEAMKRTQFDAYGNTAKRGMRFSMNASGWEYSVYQDADGDGVLNADIVAGTDPLIEGPFPLTDRISIATIGVPTPAVKHPDTGSPFPQDMKSVNFNQSSICSFSPNGDGTPGTIYLINGNPAEAAMVRSSGDGGQIRTMFYGFQGSSWKP